MTNKFNEYDNLIAKYIPRPEQVQVEENHNILYKQFRHRAFFSVGKPRDTDENKRRFSFSYSYYERIDWDKVDLIKKCLRKTPKTKSRIQLNYYNSRMVVYFADLEPFLKALDLDTKNCLSELSLMSEDVIDEYNEFKGEFRTVLKVRKNLPYNKFRYKVFTANSYYTKKNISKDSLEAALIQLENFPGIRMSSRFKSVFLRPRSYGDNYFYAENLDWLPMILLIDNRIIKTVEKYKTKEEVNESTDV